MYGRFHPLPPDSDDLAETCEMFVAQIVPYTCGPSEQALAAVEAREKLGLLGIPASYPPLAHAWVEALVRRAREARVVRGF